MNDTKKKVTMALLIALSVCLNIVESYIPLYIPGLKLGLSNIVVLFAIYIYSFKDALTLSILRIIIVGLIRTGLFSFSFFFSLGGSILSLLIMYLLKRFTKLSVIGISIIGAIFHNVGQILVSFILFKSFDFIYLLPVLIILSIVTGLIIGLISKKIISYYQEVN